jgi:hypothetical protein
LIANWQTKDSAQKDTKHSLTECNTELRNVGIAQSAHTAVVGHEYLIPSQTLSCKEYLVYVPWSKAAGA